MMALQDAGLFELGEHAVYRGEPDIQSLADEDPIDVLGGQMSNLAGFEHLEDAQPRPGCLQPAGFQIVYVRHRDCFGEGDRFRYDIAFCRRGKIVPRILIVTLSLLNAACGVLTPYRIEIQQGNYVTQEMVAQLKPGLTRDQVRFVMGTPLVSDIFHQERWDYVFTRQRANSQDVEHRRVAVFFEDGKLKRVEGDIVAAATGKPGP
jgi:outer membrane protein assembly factor BamE